MTEIAPTVVGSEILTFFLVVSDGATEDSAEVVITVTNGAPVANAGPDQTVLSGASVQLDGSASGDPDNLPEQLSFSWVQTAGSAVRCTLQPLYIVYIPRKTACET